jgi:hypothetical protein
VYPTCCNPGGICNPRNINLCEHHKNGGAITQLPEVVAPPALHNNTSKQRTGMLHTGFDLSSTCDTHDINWSRTIRVSPITQLTPFIAPPALHNTTGNGRTGVGVTGCDLTRTRNSRNFNWSQMIRGRPIAKLTETVVAPAFHRTTGNNRA